MGFSAESYVISHFETILFPDSRRVQMWIPFSDLPRRTPIRRYADTRFADVPRRTRQLADMFIALQGILVHRSASLPAHMSTLFSDV